MIFGNKKYVAGVFLWFVIFFLNCNTQEDIPLKVKEISFSDEWTGSDIGDARTTFYSPIEKVYYKIVFETPVKGANTNTLKKIWKLNGFTFLEVRCFVPSTTKRICGELHNDETQFMEPGIYTLSEMQYYSDLKTNWFAVEIPEIVNKNFEIVSRP